MKNYLLLFSLLLSPFISFATISPIYIGTVTDANGNPVVATITVINNCNNQTYTFSTDSNGVYNFQEPTFPNPQQCQITIIATSGNCADTVSFWINPGMSGSYTFNNNMQLNCNNTNNCNIAWGFNTVPADPCSMVFWHQGTSATWTFYDSNISTTTSTLTNPTHTFNGPGTYQVCIQFPNCAPQCTTVTITNNCNPNTINNCNISWGLNQSNTNPCVYNGWHQGTPGTAFWQIAGSNASYQSSTLDNPQFTFNQAGPYIVTLYVDTCVFIDTLVVDSICASANTCNYAWGFNPVPNNPCQYQFWHQAASAIWTFQTASTTITSNQFSPFFTWSTPGTYQVCVQFPNCAPQCTTITITPNCNPANASCNAYFTWYVDPTTNETYINNLSTGSPIQYMWDFGDGNNGMGFTPTHTYGGPGWYEICLTIGTPNTPACYDTYCDSVFVPSASLRVGGPAAITTWDETSDWSIYPNPVNNELFLNYTGTMTSDLTVEVISVTGQVLTSTIEKNVEPGQIIPVSFEEYAEGIYFITITSHHSQQMVTKKIMK